MTDYTELKRLAEDTGANQCFGYRNNPAYLAAVSPGVVLSMIAEIDRLRTQNQALVEALEQISKNDLHSDGDIARAALKQAEGGV